MLKLPHSTLRRIRLACGRALDVRPRADPPAVAFLATAAGLRVACTDGETTLEYADPDVAGDASFAVSFADLKRIEGTRSDLVTLATDADGLSAEWIESGVARSVRLPPAESPPVADAPGLVPCDPRLLSALSDASETTDRDSPRHALGNIHLTADGRVQATDARQLFIESGFDVPWREDLLVPANKFLSGPEFRGSATCSVGVTDTHWGVRGGPWTLWVPLTTDARFPDVDGLLARTPAAQSTIRLGESDAVFLVESAKGLPGAERVNAPLTLDAGEQVTVRVQAADAEEPHEVALGESGCCGETVRFATDRRFLFRAARLGFRILQVASPSDPIRCEDGRRLYLWATLEPSAVIAPRVGIPSHDAPEDIPSGPHTSIDESLMSSPNPDPTPIQAAELLRDSLRESLSRTRELVAALKREAKQAKLVESTLASLRKLSDAA